MSDIIKVIQEIYPNIKGGFVYWETKQDGSPLDNPIDGLIWENSEYEKPKWNDIESRLEFNELRQLKELKLKEIRDKKNEFIYLPIEYLGRKFINSEVSGNNLQAAYAFIDEPIDWLDIEGNPVTLTKLQLKELIGLILQQRSKGYFLEAQFKKQINDCSTIDELNNLVLDFK